MDMKGKIVNFLGDSITYGYGLEDNEKFRFSTLLENKLGLIANNYGVCGTRIAYQHKPSDRCVHDLFFCGRAYYMDPDADVILVFGGVNDFNHGDAPMGTVNDTEPDTFYGAVDKLINILKSTYPNAKILFATPAHCLRMGRVDSIPSNDERKTPESQYPLHVYAEAIIEKCRQHNVKVVDMLNDFEINVTDRKQCEKYTVDGLHFNEDGHIRLAERFEKLFKTI